MDDGSRELSDDEILFASAGLKIQLVILEFLPADTGEDAKMLMAAQKNDSWSYRQVTELFVLPKGKVAVWNLDPESNHNFGVYWCIIPKSQEV